MKPNGYALITGASYGLGEEFAGQLGRRGWPLVIVARSEKRLEQLRAELMSRHQVDVRSIALDLSRPGAPAELFERTQAAGLDIRLLVNNAGFGAFGEFRSIELARLRQMIDLNIAALVELTHLYLQPMGAARQGAILNIASVAGFLPLPYSAVYAATKAFVRSFSHAVQEEARQRGVRLLTVNPGATKTRFFETAGPSPMDSSYRMQTAAQVVAEALQALDRGRSVVTTGRINRLMVRVVPLLPLALITAAVGRQMRRGMKGR